jgi:hypothetical protein
MGAHIALWFYSSCVDSVVLEFIRVNIVFIS